MITKLRYLFTWTSNARARAQLYIVQLPADLFLSPRQFENRSQRRTIFLPIIDCVELLLHNIFFSFCF